MVGIKSEIEKRSQDVKKIVVDSREQLVPTWRVRVSDGITDK